MANYQFSCPTCGSGQDAAVCRIYKDSDNKYYALYTCMTCGDNTTEKEETVDIPA